MLEFVHENIWIARRPLNILGKDFGSVMTIVRMSNGSLFIHAPFDINEILERQISGLGPAGVVISPNNLRFRRTYDFLERDPEGQAFFPEKMAKRMLSGKNHSFQAQAIRSFGKSPWDQDLEHLHITGMPFVDEFVFYHKSSKTLITSDLVSHPGSSARKSARLLNRLLGLPREHPGQTRLFRACIRNKEAYNESILMLKKWDFDKVISDHGGVMEASASSLVPELML